MVTGMTTQSDPITLAFATWQAGLAYSPATIRRRDVALRTFARHLAPAPLTAATGELVEEFIAHHRAPATRRAYRADLNAFYRWAVRRGLAATNPVADTDPVRVPRTLPRPVDPALVRHLIASAGDWDTAIGIALAAYAGLRLAEIGHLERADISLATDPPVLVVRHGKGGKDRAVPVHHSLAPMLARLPAGPVIGCKARTLGEKVARHNRAQGVDATIHQLRHTFGTEAARASNGNLLIVGELMGHASIEVTRGYTKLVGVNTATTVQAMFAAA